MRTRRSSGRLRLAEKQSGRWKTSRGDRSRARYRTRSAIDGSSRSAQRICRRKIWTRLERQRATRPSRKVRHCGICGQRNPQLLPEREGEPEVEKNLGARKRCARARLGGADRPVCYSSLIQTVAFDERKTIMLETGKPFVNFNLQNQDGKEMKLGDFAGKWLVVYVYPKDDTPGCTIQGKSFTASKAD